MFDEQERDALPVQLANVLTDALDERRIDAAGRLIEQDELRLGHHHRRELEQFALTVRERAAQQAGDRGDVHGREHVHGSSALIVPLASRDECAKSRTPHRHEHVLQRGQTREDSRQLKGAADAETVDSIRSESGDRLPLEAHVTGILGEEPGDEVEDRGLSGSVRSDEPGDAAEVEGQRAPVHRGDTAETLRKALHLQQGHGDGTPATVCASLVDAVSDGPTARRAAIRLRRSPTDGMMPRGSSRMTTRNTAA